MSDLDQHTELKITPNFNDLVQEPVPGSDIPGQSHLPGKAEETPASTPAKPSGVPKTGIVAAGVVVVLLALIVLPFLTGGSNARVEGQSDVEIYHRYREIYAEIEQTRASNPEELPRLKEKWIPEINEITTGLEKSGAGTAKPAKQQLHWAGKYCLIPLLNENGPEEQTEHWKRRFQNHMESAGRFLNVPETPPLSSPDSSLKDTDSDN